MLFAQAVSAKGRDIALRRSEDAAAMVERALQLDNACPLARLTQAKLHRQAGRLVEAEQALRPILTAADRELRVRGFYELGDGVRRGVFVFQSEPEVIFGHLRSAEIKGQPPGSCQRLRFTRCDADGLFKTAFGCRRVEIKTVSAA